MFCRRRTQSTPAIIGSPHNNSNQSSSSLPALPIPPPVYQITPYLSTIESFTSTHVTTDGALSGNTSGSFDTFADEDGFSPVVFASTPSLYQPFPDYSSGSLSIPSIGHRPDIRLLIDRIFYEGEDFVRELYAQYGTGVIPGTELFVEDLVLEAEELIPPIPTPPPSYPSSPLPSRPATPLSFVTYNSGEQRQEEAEETLMQYLSSGAHPTNSTTPEST